MTEAIWVERDKSGAIRGVYANRQAGYAEEQLTDDNPDVVAFFNPPPRVPQTISDRQFFQQLAIMGAIKPTEALAAVKTGDIPATIQAFIDTLPSDQKFNAEMLLAGATIFERSHPMTAALGAGMGWKDEQLDALWTAAAAL